MQAHIEEKKPFYPSPPKNPIKNQNKFDFTLWESHILNFENEHIDT